MKNPPSKALQQSWHACRSVLTGTIKLTRENRAEAGMPARQATERHINQPFKDSDHSFALCIMLSVGYEYRNEYDEIVSTEMLMMFMPGIPAMLVGVLVSSVTVAMTVRRQVPAEIEIMPDGTCKFDGKHFQVKVTPFSTTKER